jgi:hypothetical protein
MEFTAPASFRKHLTLAIGKLVRRWILPGRVVSWLPAMMGNEKDGNGGLSRRAHNLAQMRQEIHGLGNLFGERIQFASGRKKVVIRINKQQSCPTSLVLFDTHAFSPIRRDLSQDPTGKAHV